MYLFKHLSAKAYTRLTSDLQNLNLSHSLLFKYRIAYGFIFDLVKLIHLNLKEIIDVDD